jgi:preprotein translocase subunit SecE
MNTLLIESLALVVVMVLFVLALRAGYFLKISAYWAEMMEEMRKCTWPTWDELLGSTVLVTVAVAIIGGFTVGVDYICSNIIKVIVT